MTSSLKTLALLTLPLCAAACSHQQEPARTSGYEPAMTPAARTTTTEPSSPGELGNEPSERLTDAQITTVVRAVNAAEVDQGKLAVGKVENEAVKNFAQTMIAEHGKAVKDVDALASRLALPDTDSQLVTDLRVEATRIDNLLASITDKSFDKRYILGQIEEHRRVLLAIDTRLVPAAQRDDIKELLATLRPHVVHHLQMAETILDSIK